MVQVLAWERSITDRVPHQLLPIYNIQTHNSFFTCIICTCAIIVRAEKSVSDKLIPINAHPSTCVHTIRLVLNCQVE